MELLQELGPLRRSFAFVPVIAFLLNLNCQTKIFLSECLLVLVWGFLRFCWVGTDELHVASFFVGSWPQVVSDDCCVRALMESDEVDLIAWCTLLQLSWSDGDD